MRVLNISDKCVLVESMSRYLAYLPLDFPTTNFAKVLEELDESKLDNFLARHTVLIGGSTKDLRESGIETGIEQDIFVLNEGGEWLPVLSNIFNEDIDKFINLDDRKSYECIYEDQLGCVTMINGNLDIIPYSKVMIETVKTIKGPLGKTIFTYGSPDPIKSIQTKLAQRKPMTKLRKSLGMKKYWNSSDGAERKKETNEDLFLGDETSVANPVVPMDNQSIDALYNYISISAVSTDILNYMRDIYVDEDKKIFFVYINDKIPQDKLDTFHSRLMRRFKSSKSYEKRDNQYVIGLSMDSLDGVDAPSQFEEPEEEFEIVGKVD